MTREEIILADSLFDLCTVPALVGLASTPMFNVRFFTKEIGNLVVTVIQH